MRAQQGSQIDGINAQLALAQRQLDALNGINSTGLTMITALNNLAAAMEAQQSLRRHRHQEVRRHYPTPPVVRVPDVIWNSNHGYTRESGAA